jgi:hypothetical protein
MQSSKYHKCCLASLRQHPTESQGCPSHSWPTAITFSHSMTHLWMLPTLLCW